MGYYKYTNINTAVLVLLNGSIRWSSPILFNDLEECQFTPFTKVQHSKAHDAYIKILTECAKGNSKYDVNQFSDITKSLIHLFRLSIDKGTFDDHDFSKILTNISSNPESDYRDFMNTALIRCFRVLCVTETHDNILMWAHYADQHCGCVFEFDDLYIEKPRLLREGYVRYHENIEPRSSPLDMLLYGETNEVRELMIRDVAFSKRTFWGYEREYRFLFAESFGEITTKIDMQNGTKNIDIKHQSDQLFSDVKFPKESLKSVIFGARSSQDKICEVVQSLKDGGYHCNLYQMKMREGKLEKEGLNLDEAMFTSQCAAEKT